MNAILHHTAVPPAGNHEATRFNGIRHGILSRYTVLPWENEEDYRNLVEALAAEHAPVGPTEENLVEELAGVIWRKRRLRMAEAAIAREQLRHDALGYNEPEHIAEAALLPVTGLHGHKADVPQAVAADPVETARDLRAVRRDQAMTQRALKVLGSGGPDAYIRALAALQEDTRSYWQECLADPRQTA